MSKVTIPPGEYTYDADNSTIEIVNISTVHPERIFLIANATRGTLLYHFGDTDKALQIVGGNQIILGLHDIGDDDADELTILYDTLPGDPVYDLNLEALQSALEFLQSTSVSLEEGLPPIGDIRDFLIEFLAPAGESIIGFKDDAAELLDNDATLMSRLRSIATFLRERLPSSLGRNPSNQSLSVTLASEDNDTQTGIWETLGDVLAEGEGSAEGASITARLQNVLAELESIEANTDSLETLLGEIVDVLEQIEQLSDATATNTGSMDQTLSDLLNGSNDIEALIGGTDFATQTTLAAILAKIISAPATEAKQDAGNTSLATIAGKDFATQTTLAAILAKIIAAPATEAKQDTQITKLTSIDGKDFATQTTLAAILAKIIAAPATEAKQDAGNTTLASILAKIIAAPATEAKQDSNAVDGAAGDGAVVTDTTGTHSGKLRGLVKWAYERMPAALGLTTASGSLPIVIASDDSVKTNVSTLTTGFGTNSGSASDVAVTGDSSGTMHAKVRGIIKMLGDVWDSTNHFFKVGLNYIGGTAIATNTGSSSAGTQRVVIATDQPALTNTLLVDQQATATGGADTYRVLSAASNNAASVKGSAGKVYTVSAFNLNASPRYVKLYNKATSPSPGSDNSLLLCVIMIPGNSLGSGVVIPSRIGRRFSSGIGIAIVTGISDTDNTSVAASEILVNLEYK